MTKVLILYASKKGATEEVVKYISDILQKHGLNVELANAKDFDTTRSDYDVLIAGSGIYRGMILPEIMAAIRRIPADELGKIPVWAFGLCVRILEPNGQAYIAEHYTPQRVFKKLNLKEFRFFAGRLENLSIEDHATLRERYDGESYLRYLGDHRDWDAIKAYALEIVDALK